MLRVFVLLDKRSGSEVRRFQASCRLDIGESQSPDMLHCSEEQWQDVNSKCITYVGWSVRFNSQGGVDKWTSRGGDRVGLGRQMCACLSVAVVERRPSKVGAKKWAESSASAESTATV